MFNVYLPDGSGFYAFSGQYGDLPSAQAACTVSSGRVEQVTSTGSQVVYVCP
jgi:hypothetical protein